MNPIVTALRQQPFKPFVIINTRSGETVRIERPEHVTEWYLIDNGKEFVWMPKKGAEVRSEGKYYPMPLN